MNRLALLVMGSRSNAPTRQKRTCGVDRPAWRRLRLTVASTAAGSKSPSITAAMSAPRSVCRIWNSRTAGACSSGAPMTNGCTLASAYRNRSSDRPSTPARSAPPSLVPAGVKRSVSSYLIIGWVRLCKFVTSTLDEATPSGTGWPSSSAHSARQVSLAKVSTVQPGSL